MARHQAEEEYGAKLPSTMMREEDEVPTTDVELNTTQEYATYRRQAVRLQESRECCYFWRVVYFIWKRLLFPLEPIWQILIVVVATVGSFLASLRTGQEDEVAAITGVLVGCIVGLLLLCIWNWTYKSGMFVDPVSRHQVRNELHGPIIGGYLMQVIILLVFVWAIITLIQNCDPKAEVKCTLRSVFIVSHTNHTWPH